MSVGPSSSVASFAFVGRTFLTIRSFRPERVQAIAARLATLDLERALEWYQCAGPEYVTSYWPRKLMLAHLEKVIGLWREAAAQGEAVLHTEF